MNNYTIYHCHTDISNLSGAGMDSVTKYQDYIARAKECGMNALCFSEHGNFFLWKKKKDAIEAAGMKYLHGIEIYVAEKLLWETEDNPTPHKVRDNYHCVLIAKNLVLILSLSRLNQAVSPSTHLSKVTSNFFAYVFIVKVKNNVRINNIFFMVSPI